jgi:hypothetical protein
VLFEAARLTIARHRERQHVLLAAAVAVFRIDNGEKRRVCAAA